MQALLYTDTSGLLLGRVAVRVVDCISTIIKLVPLGCRSDKGVHRVIGCPQPITGGLEP